MSRMTLKVLLGTWVIPVMTFHLYGQAPLEGAVDTVVISTARLALPVEQTGRSITVISGAEIQRLPASSLDEVLRYITGVEAQSRAGFGAQSDLIIRGSTFSQVLVLIDGIRFNNPLTGHFNGYLPIPLTEISRIEVLRGPAAAVYGPDAVGGVIHVITRSFAGDAGEQGWSTAGEAGLGEFGLGYATGGATLQHQRLRISAGGTWQESPGQHLPSGTRNDFRLWQAGAAIAYQGDKWQLAYRGTHDERLFNAQYFYTRSTADQSREEVRHTWHQARILRHHSRGSTRLDLNYTQSADSFLFNPQFPANVHTMRVGAVQLIHTFRASSQWAFSTGIQWDRRDIESTDRGDHQNDHAGLFLSAVYQPLLGLTITGGLRGDGDDNYGWETLPQLSLAYQRGVLLLRAASGRSIRAADFTERFISNNLPGPLSEGRNLGNPNLEAERSWAHELGVDYRPQPGWSASMTYFIRQGNNLIDYLLTPESQIANNENLTPGASYFYTQNLSEATTQGLEAEVKFRHSWQESLHLTGTVGYLFASTEAEQGVLSKYIANHARHLLTVQGGLSHRRFDFFIHGLWKERDAEAVQAINAEMEKSYTVWHARATLYPFSTRQLGLTLQVRNLFDARYQDILGAQMPKRWTLGGISWNFSGK